MALKDALIFTPYAEEELEAKFKLWFREILQEGVKEEEVHQEPEEKLLSLNEVCEFFGKSRQTIYAWMKKGYLKFYKISNRTYFLKRDLLEALNEIHLKEGRGR